MNKICFLLFFFGYGFSLYAQNGQTVLSSQQVREDVDYYVKTLEEVHPNIYFKISKDSVRKRMDDIVAHAPMTVAGFERLLSQTNCFFDGHTYASKYRYQDDADILQYIKEGGLFLPETILLNDSTAVLTDSIHGAVTILSINGIPIRDILTKIGSIESMENEKYRLCYLQARLMKDLYQLCGIKNPFSEVGIAGNDTIKMKLDGITQEEAAKLKQQNVTFISHKRRNNPLRSFFYDADSIAVLQYNTSNLERIKSTGTFLDDFFTQVQKRKIKYLFIDIASNGGGGSGTNNLVIQWLQHGSLSNRNKVTMKKAQFIAQFGSDIKGEYIFDTLADTYTWTGNYTILAQRNGFAGDVYLLQSKYTYSAGDDFSQLAKSNKLTVIAGEPTGQPLNSCSQAYESSLPNSKLYFRCATKYFEKLDIDNCTTESVCPDISFEIGCELPDEFPLEQLKDIINRSRGLAAEYRRLKENLFTSPQKTYTAKELQGDIDYYFATLNEVCPDLAAFISPAALDRMKAGLHAQFNKPSQSADFIKTFGSKNYLFGSSFDPTNTFNTFGIFLFPKIRIANTDKAYIQPDSVSTWEVLSINGRRVDKLLDSMACFISENNAVCKRCELENKFSYYLPLFNIHAPYNIEIGENGKRRTTEISGLLSEDWQKLYDEKRQAIPPYELHCYPAQSMAVIAYNTSASSLRKSEDFGRFLKTAFDSIRKAGIQNLFIDLSRNTGDADIADTPQDSLLNYLTVAKFDWPLELKVRKIKDVSEFFFDESDDYGSIKTEVFPLSFRANQGFGGKLYVIQSSKTSGYAAALSGLLKKIGKATICGTSNSIANEILANPYPISLPATKWVIRVNSTEIKLPDVDFSVDVPFEIGCTPPASYSTEQLEKMIGN